MPDPLVWSISANGGEDILERYGFLTDIIESYRQSEQRIILREIPLERFEFSFLCEDREAQLAQSLLYAGHDEILAVPIWHLGSPLTADISIGATLLPIADALEVGYRRSVDNGGYALVWNSPFDWELFEVSSTSASGVTTLDLATKAWPSGVGTLVFPARPARIYGEPQIRWLNSRALIGRLTFDVEPI